MHTEAVVGEVVPLLEPCQQVVGIEHGILADLPQARASQGPDVGIGPDQHPEVSVEARHLADAPLRVSQDERLPPISLSSLYHWRRKERRQPLPGTDGARAWPASTMGGAEGLVQIEVRHVESQRAQLGLAQQRVHIRAVAVDQPAGIVDHLADLQDIPLEETQGAGQR